MENFLSATLLSFSLLTSARFTFPGELLVAKNHNEAQSQILARKEMDLSTRYLQSSSVNEVFADNILLNLHYLMGDAKNLKDEKGQIDWGKVREPFNFTLILEPSQTFSYHSVLSPEFKNKDVLAAQTTFWSSEGYKSDGYLVGDGVCHLASLFNWVSSEAGLEVVAKVRHDFLPVPGIPQEYGTSIFYSQNGARNSANQNLYITNNFTYPVEFEISADGKKVEIAIETKNK